ncbi:MAG: ACT domain-containing protein, partial [Methanomassiliicoccus sp.]
KVDIVPEGNLLLISHMDKPGMIGKVGTVLGDNDVNIASMEVARQETRGPAMMILEIDESVSPEVLEKVKAIPDLTSATYIRL